MRVRKYLDINSIIAGDTNTIRRNFLVNKVKNLTGRRRQWRKVETAAAVRGRKLEQQHLIHLFFPAVIQMLH